MSLKGHFSWTIHHFVMNLHLNFNNPKPRHNVNPKQEDTNFGIITGKNVAFGL